MKSSIRLFVGLCAATLFFPGIPALFGGVPAHPMEILLPYYSLTGNIINLDQIDYYKFTGNAGQEVALCAWAQSQGSTLVPIVALYDSNGKMLAYNDIDIALTAGEISQDPALYVKLPVSGTYYASVSSAAVLFRKPNLSSTTGPYVFVVDSGGDHGRIGDPYESNDTMASATAIAPPFRSYGTNLQYFGDMDWFSFTAKKGRKFLIDIDAAELKHTTGWETAVKARIGVFDAKGQLLDSSEHGVDLDSGYGEDPAAVFTVPRDGTYYVVVTSFLNSGFRSIFSDETFLADPYVGSRTGRIGQYMLQVREVTTLLFPQVANGSFGETYFKTSIILINSTAEAAGGKICFYGADGGPMPVPLEGGDTLDTWHFTLPAKSSLVLKTNGRGSGASGYAVVMANAPVAGSTVFSQYGANGKLVTEAGVSSGSIMDFFAIPVDTTGDFNTGIAVLNSESAAPVGMYLRLLDGTGKTIASRTMTLAPGRQIAQFVFGADQLFPSAGRFRGSLQVYADAPLTTVALRSSSRTLTTLTPSPVNQSYEPASLLFPQIVVGSSGPIYRTSVMLMNTGYFGLNGSIRFTRSEGTPMSVSIGGVQSSVHSFTIPPLSTIFLEASAPGSLETGYASVSADHGFGGAAVIAQYSAAGVLECEVGVGPAGKYSHFYVFAENENGYNTGVALANPGSVSAILEYELRPSDANAKSLHNGPIALQSGQHRADLVSGLNQLFPTFSGLGTLEVTSAVPIPAIALRISAGTMTSLPVIPAPQK